MKTAFDTWLKTKEWDTAPSDFQLALLDAWNEATLQTVNSFLGAFSGSVDESAEEEELQPR